MSRTTLLSLAAAAATAEAVFVPGAADTAEPEPGRPGVVDYTVPAARDADPVILTGAQFGLDGSWSVPSNLTVRQPQADLTECGARLEPGNAGDPTEGGGSTIGDVVQQGCPEGYDEHSHYGKPQVDTARDEIQGTPVGQLAALRWNAETSRFEQIPFQVDEVFTRYLNNTASGFAIYSGEDQHTTYAYDREGFRFTQSGAADSEDPCTARMKDGDAAAADPVKGLDSNDELVFMASDAGIQAPAYEPLPAGTKGVKVVRVTDPTNPKAAPSFVYVVKGVTPKFTAENGYVDYQRDADADQFEYSQSSYGSYGAAPKGHHCDDEGNVVRNDSGAPKIEQRRPRDGATITTDRYKFRYDGRWLMTGIQIVKGGDGCGDFGPDLVDRWKARAFAQDPGSQTPCCGYEEEDTNWGGSSILLGERVGPVRAIRETWGADSGTNVIRRETFYRETMRQKTWLRVHVMPPLDGIYAQWDFNAGRVSKFYYAYHPDGVEVDGKNDEVYGNFDDPCNSRWEANDRSKADEAYRDVYQQAKVCDAFKAISEIDDMFDQDQVDYYHQSVDPGDATFADANAALGWSLIAGENGSIVDRITAQPQDLSPGGAAQSVVAVPYYRDDACFDDGTGTNPGPVLNLRSGDETKTAPDGTPRKCWAPEDGDPGDDPKYFQGSIGTHGLHLLFLVDSDNARQPAPLTELVNEWQMVMLPGERSAEDGERYGRSFEKPLVAVVTEDGGGPRGEAPPEEEPPGEEEPPSEEQPPGETPTGEDKQEQKDAAKEEKQAAKEEAKEERRESTSTSTTAAAPSTKRTTPRRGKPARAAKCPAAKRAKTKKAKRRAQQRCRRAAARR